MEKLLEYSKYKAASRYLEERENIGAYMFYKKPDKLEDVKIENHFEGVSVQDLFEMVRELLQNKKEQIIIPQKSFGAIASRETVTEMCIRDMNRIVYHRHLGGCVCLLQ